MISLGHIKDSSISKKSLVFIAKLMLSCVMGKGMLCSGAALPVWALELSVDVARLTPEVFMLNSKSAAELKICHVWRATTCQSQNETFRNKTGPKWIKNRVRPDKSDQKETKKAEVRRRSLK